MIALGTSSGPIPALIHIVFHTSDKRDLNLVLDSAELGPGRFPQSRAVLIVITGSSIL